MIFFADMSQNLSDMLEDIEEEIEKEDTKAGKPGRLFLVTLLALQTLFQ